MIFLDNSSSSFFKPTSVIAAACNTLRFLPFNPSRSGHSGALKAGRLLYATRKNLAEFFNCPVENVIFTSGCTEALNLAVLGSVVTDGHVITTPFEHNSILRPLYHLSRKGIIKISLVTSPKAADAAVRQNTCLIAINHVSNVTGDEYDLNGYGAVALKHNVPLLVDAAQSAGHIAIDIKSQNISYLAIAPHKGLHAAQGAGALMVAENSRLNPIKFGGTGTASSSPVQPNGFPEGFEAGTLPLPAIATINAGLNWTKTNFDFNNKKLLELSSHLIERLSSINGVALYSKVNACGIVSLNIRGYESQDAGDILNEQYDIAVRCGFHCAPLLHEYYGTDSGMIRASIGCNNTYAEIDFFAEAVREMAGEK